jgi:O-antigen ligase
MKCSSGINMPESRFNLKYITLLIGVASCTFVISLFLMQILFAIIFILWIVEKNSEKKKVFNSFTFAIILWGVIRIITVIFSHYPFESIQIFYKEALFYASFFSLQFYFKSMSKDQISSVIKYFIIGGILSSLSGIALFNLNLVDRAQSFSSSYTVFSSYLLIVLPALLFLPQNILSGKIRIASIVIIVIGLITSMGRANILIAAVLVLFSLFMKKISILNFLSIIIIAGSISYISFENNKKEITNRMINPGTLSDRDIIWKGASELRFNHPFLGFGPRTFQQIFPYKNEFNDKGIAGWHNDFLQVYFESGILGLISFLYIIFLIIYYGKTSFKIKNMCNPGIFLALIGLVLSAFTAGFITSVVLSIVFVFLLTIYDSSVYAVKINN